LQPGHVATQGMSVEPGLGLDVLGESSPQVSQAVVRRGAGLEVALDQPLPAALSQNAAQAREVLEQAAGVAEPELFTIDLELLCRRKPFVAPHVAGSELDNLGVCVQPLAAP